MRLETNHHQVERVARRLVELNWKSSGFPALEAAPPGHRPDQMVDFFFFNSALLFDFAALFLDFYLVQPGSQDAHRPGAVLKLRTLVLALYDNSGRLVGQPDCSGVFLHALASRSG